MKRVLTIVLTSLILSFGLLAFTPPPGGKSSPASPQYVVIAWNDLGMRCANLDFSNLCILPPYNTQKVQVILRGNASTPPQLVNASGGTYVTYEIPGNTESATKTNFWNYAQVLFGVALPPNIGLTGAGMTGTMSPGTGDYFIAEGIPVTAFPDATPAIADPYQLTLIKAYSSTGQLLATTQSVIPVSHEINCVSSGCHASELAILNQHEHVTGFDVNNRPIFCAKCHSDNALGMPGQAGVPPFSQVIHEKHGEFINSGTSSDCYKCHPGPNTQCWRDVMHYNAGSVTKCQSCHGSVSNVGHSIDSGRQPWLQEPSCGATSCHGANYAEEPGKLYRNSKGHGGLYCSACHGSPHAIFPTINPRDNAQNVSLQGFQGTLTDCAVCHGYIPSGPGPHGIILHATRNDTVRNNQSECFPSTGTLLVSGGGTSFVVQTGGSATFVSGKNILFLPGTKAEAGGYLHGYISTNGQYCGKAQGPVAMGEQADFVARPGVESPVYRIYPNPTNGEFMLEIDGPDGETNSRVDLFNAGGVKLITRDLPGNGTYGFGLSGYPAGVYYLRAVSGARTATLKIVRQ